MDFEVKKNTPLGSLLDRAIREANVLDLGDYYLGSQADYDQDIVSVYFTEDAEETILEELSVALEEEDVECALEKVEENGASFVLHLKPIPEESATSGNIPVAVKLSGNISVDDKQAGEKSDVYDQRAMSEV